MKMLKLLSKKVNIQTHWLIPLFVIGIEVLFHLEIYGKIDIHVLHAILFSLPFSFFVLLLSSTKYEKWNKGIRCVSLLLIVAYYIIQIIYHQVFDNFLSLKSIFNGADQAMDFGYTIWKAFMEHVVIICVAVGAWVLYVVLEMRSVTQGDALRDAQDDSPAEPQLSAQSKDDSKNAEADVQEPDGDKQVWCKIWNRIKKYSRKQNSKGQDRLEQSSLGQDSLEQNSEKQTNKNQNWMKWKQSAIYLVSIVVLPIAGTLLLMAEGTGIGSTYDVKMRFHRMEQSMYRLGLIETLGKDIRENLCDKLGITERQANVCYLWIEDTFFDKDVDNLKKEDVKEDFAGTKDESGESDGDGETTGNENVTGKEPTEAAYHTWDIDFNTLIQSTDDEDLKDVHTYFASQESTAENEYTGLFEGYNLLYITAESFSDVVIDKERTPTLYRMQQEGFQFENFYTPSWYLSTIDGEYVNCLGQIPVEGDWSLQHSAENVLPMALGNQLQEKGYVCNAYHNHDSYYYDRTVTHPKLGYTFKAVGAGLTFESMYPESDLELMEITVDEYIGKEPFHTYYMTMSGHLPYTYDYNSMAVKNRDVTEGKEWSEDAACYLAANTELEYAVAYLVERLEKAGQLDNTLFVIAPDHYPYGLKKGAYDELRGYEVESDEFEIYRNGCLIWSASMKDMEEVTFPVKVDKYCSNLDLLPTISNLMGLSYDSRLLAGRDMLSEDMGIVMFKDRSFLTDKVRYNATTGEVEWAAGKQETIDYLENCMELVQNRFYYSAKVLEWDYMGSVR